MSGRNYEKQALLYAHFALHANGDLEGKCVDSRCPMRQTTVPSRADALFYLKLAQFYASMHNTAVLERKETCATGAYAPPGSSFTTAAS